LEVNTLEKVEFKLKHRSEALSKVVSQLRDMCFDQAVIIGIDVVKSRKASRVSTIFLNTDLDTVAFMIAHLLLSEEDLFHRVIYYMANPAFSTPPPSYNPV